VLELPVEGAPELLPPPPQPAHSNAARTAAEKAKNLTGSSATAADKSADSLSLGGTACESRAAGFEALYFNK